MKYLLVAAILSFCVVSCGKTNRGEDLVQMSEQLHEQFGQLSDPESGLLKQDVATDYLAKVAHIATSFPRDTAIAMHLYRAAEVARAMNQAPLAIDYYQRITKDFPNFSRAAEAYFMLAFTYDENLKDLEQATIAYERFIKQYPAHDFADDAAILLKNLGKSDEEILQELEASLANPAASN